MQSKTQFELLNALRFLAALLVIAYHYGEAFATSPCDQAFNHGYLAVDFFFVLSGFVIGYSYDDRWQTLSSKEFFIRRLRRLHPMLIIGALLGACTFLLQGSTTWNGAGVGFTAVLCALAFNLVLIPLLPNSTIDVRGNGEMFPLNGPTWSLFFEYIGNILYALALRKLSTRYLFYVVIASALCLIGFAVGNGSGFYHMGVGWTLADNNFLGGMLRLLFPYSMGMLIARMFFGNAKETLSRNNILCRFADYFRSKSHRLTSTICSLLIIALLAIPYIGHGEPSPTNGLYDAFCIIVVFPMIIILGISAAQPTAISSKFYHLIGDMSYPLYIVHYPFMYLYYAKVWDNNLTFSQTTPYIALVFCISITLAYLLRRCRL